MHQANLSVSSDMFNQGAGSAGRSTQGVGANAPNTSSSALLATGTKIKRPKPTTSLKTVTSGLDQSGLKSPMASGASNGGLKYAQASGVSS